MIETLAAIARRVAAEYGVPVSAIIHRGDGIRQPCNVPRLKFFFEAHATRQFSNGQIARFARIADHTTVVKGRRSYLRYIHTREGHPPMLTPAHAALAAAARDIVKTDSLAFEELIRMGMAPETSTMALSHRLKDAVTAYEISLRAAAAAPFRQLISAAGMAASMGDAETAARYLGSLQLLIDFVGEEDQSKLDQVVATFRDARQNAMMQWAEATFVGIDVRAIRERANRFLEEAIELHQACYVGTSERAQDARAESAAMVVALANRTAGRPTGDPVRELGQAGMTLAVLAEALGRSLHAEEGAEFDRVLQVDPAEFQARHQAKIDAGL